MVRADQTELEPADVVDRLLWQDAQQMLGRHNEPDQDGTCVWCGWRWPCAPRRLAERAEAASRRSWRVAWTLRHDLNSMRAMPGLRTGLGANGGRLSRGSDSPRRPEDPSPMAAPFQAPVAAPFQGLGSPRRPEDQAPVEALRVKRRAGTNRGYFD